MVRRRRTCARPRFPSSRAGGLEWRWSNRVSHRRRGGGVPMPREEETSQNCLVRFVDFRIGEAVLHAQLQHCETFGWAVAPLVVWIGSQRKHGFSRGRTRSFWVTLPLYFHFLSGSVWRGCLRQLECHDRRQVPEFRRSRAKISSPRTRSRRFPRGHPVSLLTVTTHLSMTCLKRTVKSST